MESKKKYKLEWGISLLNKYSHIFIEKKLHYLKLTKTQVIFILHIKQKNGIYQDKLAQMLKMNKSTVTRAINHLEKLGYVNKTIDKYNKKANILELTDLGNQIYHDVEKVLNEWIEIITKGFNEQEVQMAISIITKMASRACAWQGDNYLSKLIEMGG